MYAYLSELLVDVQVHRNLSYAYLTEVRFQLSFIFMIPRLAIGQRYLNICVPRDKQALRHIGHARFCRFIVPGDHSYHDLT